MLEERYTPIDLKDTNFFKPLKLSSNITLQHRGVMAPLTRLRNKKGNILNQSTDYLEEEDWKAFVGEPSNKTGEKKRGLVEEYYHQRSQKKGTLIIIEGTIISSRFGGTDVAPAIFDEEQIQSLSTVIKAIHANESYTIVQIAGLGRQADPSVLKRNGYPFASSSAVYMAKNDIRNIKQTALESGNPLRALTHEEINDIKTDFIKAAKNSLKAGADGVEIHGANGYLLNQFLDKKVNQRSDEYGTQNFENRSRLLLELYDELAAEIGSEKISVRVSPFNSMGDMTGYEDNSDTIEFYSYLYEELEKRRVNGSGPLYVSLIEPRNDEMSGEKQEPDVSNNFIFDKFYGHVMRAGNILLDGDYTKGIISQNDRTLIAFGRYFISNPDLIERFEKSLPINKYDRDTFYTQDHKGYIDYPYYKENK